MSSPIPKQQGMKARLTALRTWLEGRTFRTGVVVLALCVPCYVLSFAQMGLDLPTSTKAVLWFVLYGMAKTFQYAGLTILGVKGVKRVKAWWKSR